MKECQTCQSCYPDEVVVCANEQSPTRNTLPGPQLLAKRYFLERRIGRGAMGQVYLTRDENLGTRHVAVKTVRPDFLDSENLPEGEAISRFEHEARAAALIRHPHVVTVTDFGKTPDGVFFLAMEYVEGETLHHLLRREGALSIRRTVKLLRQICDGVEAAHELGIVHRDLKPANIFILKKRKDGDDGFVKVGDFGLAKIMRKTIADPVNDSAPASRGIVGTPEFMAPEQMQPGSEITFRADIYALGTIAYSMISGRTPYIGDLMELVTQKMTQPPPPPSSFRTDIPPKFEEVIMRALERDPENRPENVFAWMCDLEAAAENETATESRTSSHLVVQAPVGAEVYLDDERRGSIGNSLRLRLVGIPSGKHVLRVTRAGEKDDERVIEIADGASENIIHSVLGQSLPESNPETQGRISGESTSAVMPQIVVCVNCSSRFAEGVKFCGRCGKNSFRRVAQINDADSFPCPQCATRLPQAARFCARCGLQLKPEPQSGANRSLPRSVERICRNCGATFGAGVKFCGRCGFNLNH